MRLNAVLIDFPIKFKLFLMKLKDIHGCAFYFNSIPDFKETNETDALRSRS